MYEMNAAPVDDRGARTVEKMPERDDLESQPVALPILIGRPTYVSPTRFAPRSPRPPDVDDLPLTVFRRDQVSPDRETLLAGECGPQQDGPTTLLRSRSLRLRSLAARLFGAA